MKLYTRTGDQGTTSVIGGRVKKDSVRVEAYGTVDELNAFVGQAILQFHSDPTKFQDMIQDLTVIQHELFDAGADLALVKVEGNQTYKIQGEQVTRLETWIDKYDGECPPIQRFILPGGSAPSAALHICRVIARRAERRVVTLAELESVNTEVRRYLNRLSDLFFAMARACNARAGLPDVEYRSGR
jgi:cob(I)alamin adenosyltransferase